MNTTIKIAELKANCTDDLLAGCAMQDHVAALTALVEVMDARTAISVLAAVTGIVVRATERHKKWKKDHDQPFCK